MAQNPFIVAIHRKVFGTCKMTIGNETPLKVKAKDNPWYLLATLYGEPSRTENSEVQANNRRTWNRYMFQWIKEDRRTSLPAHFSSELTEFSREELETVNNAYIERHRSAASTASV